MAEVAGVLRRGAAQAKEWSEGEVAFSDLAPEDLGLDAIWETFPGSPAEQPEETLFTTRSGKVVGKMELVALALDDERRPMVARLFGMDTDDPALRLMVLKAIDYIEAQLVAGPTWVEETPEAEPVVRGALDPVAVIRNGVEETIGGEELAQMVNRASDNVPM